MSQYIEEKNGYIRLAGVVKESIVDGPGIRFTIFCQGCPHACPECHNPNTHDFNSGTDVEISKIINAINENPLLSGVTFSGGEPFCQPKAFLEIAKHIDKNKLNIMAYSGYTFEELEDMASRDEDLKELLGYLDYLVDGRFVKSKKDLSLPFRGSSNQRFIDLNKTREQKQIVLFSD